MHQTVSEQIVFFLSNNKKLLYSKMCSSKKSLSKIIYSPHCYEFLLGSSSASASSPFTFIAYFLSELN